MPTGKASTREMESKLSLYAEIDFRIDQSLYAEIDFLIDLSLYEKIDFLTEAPRRRLELLRPCDRWFSRPVPYR